MISKNLIFSDAQALTTTANATDDIDMGPGKDSFGTSKPNTAEDMWLGVRVNTAFGGGTNIATKLQDSADGSSWADTSIVGAAVATANLTQGAWIHRVRVPRGTRRYLRIVYTISGTYTSGKMDAFLAETLEQLS